MLKSIGKVSVSPGRIVLDVSYDFIEYYKWFIHRHFWVLTHSPKFEAHISIASDRFNPGVDYNKALKYQGRKLSFDYEEFIRVGGKKKGFYLFWVKVFSDEIDELKRDIGVVEPPTYLGLHLSICQIGKRGVEPSQWWPDVIKL